MQNKWKNFIKYFWQIRILWYILLNYYYNFYTSKECKQGRNCKKFIKQAERQKIYNFVAQMRECITQPVVEQIEQIIHEQNNEVAITEQTIEEVTTSVE